MTPTVAALSGRVQLTVRNTRNTRVRCGVAGACLVALAAGGCSSAHHSDASGPTPSTATQSASAARSTHLLRIGKIDIESAGRAARLDRSLQRAVLAIAQRYVDSAILAPL